MPAPLDLFIQSRSGSTPGRLRSSDEKVLEQLLAYDPGARFVTEGAGGEGGGGGETYIDYDESKLPAFKGDLNQVREVMNNKLRDPSKVTHDDVYGDWTNHANIIKEKDPLWVKIAPLLVAMAAPAAAGALYAGGLGIGAAGTAAATGAAAGGLGAGVATGATTGLPSWATSMLRSLPQTARSIASGGFNPEAFARQIASIGAGQLGVPSNVISGANTAYSLAQMYQNTRKR